MLIGFSGESMRCNGKLLLRHNSPLSVGHFLGGCWWGARFLMSGHVSQLVGETRSSPKNEIFLSIPNSPTFSFHYKQFAAARESKIRTHTIISKCHRVTNKHERLASPFPNQARCERKKKVQDHQHKLMLRNNLNWGENCKLMITRRQSRILFMQPHTQMSVDIKIDNKKCRYHAGRRFENTRASEVINATASSCAFRTDQFLLWLCFVYLTLRRCLTFGRDV